MKNLKQFFTALLLLCCTIATAEEVTIDGIKYDVIIKAKQATVIAGDTEYSGDIIIPSEITHNDVIYKVTSIGDRAFSGCFGLTSIEIPNSVTSIGEYAFENCYGLTSIEIPNSVTSIGGRAFYYCSELTSITIGNSVTSIGEYAFWFCSGLTSITIPNSVTSIGDRAFASCSGLTSITIGNSVTSIGNNAFSGCSGLTSITIPNSVTSIGKYAFENCSGLASVTIGSGVESIYEYAFASCENLTDVYCLATTAPTTTYSGNVIINQFEDSYPEYMTLHVPAEAVESYRATAPWSGFGTIVTLDGEEVETPKCATPVISYENGQLLITCDTKDAEFVTEITNSYVNKYYNSAIDLTATYSITTYATLSGYENSEVATATLCWVEKESVPTDITKIESTAVLITTRNGDIVLKGVEAGTEVAVYDINGMEIYNAVANGGDVVVSTSLEKGAVAVVKIGNRAVKVTMN